MFIGPVLSIFLLMLVGYAARKLRLLRREDCGVLNDIVIYLTLPAFVFNAIYSYKQPITPAMIKVPLAGLLAIFVMLAAAFVTARALGLKKSMYAAFILAAAFGNTGFLGYPLVDAAFRGREGALVGAVLYDELAMALPLYTLGLVIIAAFSGERVDRAQLLRTLKFPQLWAIPAALLVRLTRIPDPIADAIGYLAAGTVPLVMISLGVSLSTSSLKGYGPAVAGVCALKLAVLPLITSVAARGAGIDGVMYQVITVQSGMPTALLVGVLISKFGKNSDFAAGAIFVATLLSIVTIPLTLFLVGVSP